jgi:hypothetical protein
MGNRVRGFYARSVTPPAAAPAVTELTCWVSPQDHFQAVADVLNALHTVAAAFPGTAVRVALPTSYGLVLQAGEVGYRELGDALCPPSMAGYTALRQTFERAGFPCDGWCVPRLAAGSVGAEGTEDGQLASAFERFLLNVEAGWSGFLLDTTAAAARTYLGAFWQAVGVAGADPLVAMTLVNNSMLTALPDDAKAAWFDGTHLTLTESYGPGGAYRGRCDPATDLPAVRALQTRLGFPGRPVLPILAPPNPLGAQAVAAGGVSHLWTLESASAAL